MNVMDFLKSEPSARIMISSHNWMYWNSSEECWIVCYRLENQPTKEYKTYEEGQAIAMLLSLEGRNEYNDTNFE